MLPSCRHSFLFTCMRVCGGSGAWVQRPAPCHCASALFSAPAALLTAIPDHRPSAPLPPPFPHQLPSLPSAATCRVLFSSPRVQIPRSRCSHRNSRRCLIVTALVRARRAGRSCGSSMCGRWNSSSLSLTRGIPALKPTLTPRLSCDGLRLCHSGIACGRAESVDPVFHTPDSRPGSRWDCQDCIESAVGVRDVAGRGSLERADWEPQQAYA